MDTAGQRGGERTAGGSGTAIVAAEKTGRRCFAIELDPRFLDVIVLRWQRLSGKDAVVGGEHGA